MGTRYTPPCVTTAGQGSMHTSRTTEFGAAIAAGTAAGTAAAPTRRGGGYAAICRAAAGWQQCGALWHKAHSSEGLVDEVQGCGLKALYRKRNTAGGGLLCGGGGKRACASIASFKL